MSLAFIKSLIYSFIQLFIQQISVGIVANRPSGPGGLTLVFMPCLYNPLLSVGVTCDSILANRICQREKDFANYGAIINQLIFELIEREIILSGPDLIR